MSLVEGISNVRAPCEGERPSATLMRLRSGGSPFKLLSPGWKKRKIIESTDRDCRLFSLGISKVAGGGGSRKRTVCSRWRTANSLGATMLVST
ncbi:Hypothetical protein NTJ_12580 [Nesidiocoris tenuis]|uniref:Uncharacterized protein n=1 Tax=Nesidiocoris tenuis TaxID=355587 RepID=A0ABN7B5T7_9HEMI|nr:Hypothetical protein NTJ_12580 [Nesidiocoris tenuis]